MKKSIKIISLIISAATILSAGAIFSAGAAEFDNYYPDSECIYGDVNGDDIVTVKDATSIQKHLAKLNNLSYKSILLADVDGNGKVTISDATDIQKYVSHIINYFDIDPITVINAEETIKLKFESEEKQEILVTIDTDGYYTFRAECLEGEPCGFYVMNDRGNGTCYNDYFEGYTEASAYIRAGRYIVNLYPSYDSEYDLISFSVKNNSEDMPFNPQSATHIKPGDTIEVSQGTKTKILKIHPKDLDHIGEGHIIFTEGENPDVSLEIYDSFLNKLRYSNTIDYGNGNTVTELFLNTDPVTYKSLVDWTYIVINQKDGGSDYSVYCDSLVENMLNDTMEIKADEAEKLDLLLRPSGPEGATLYGEWLKRSFTPAESGYYNLSIDCKDIFAAYSLWGTDYPDKKAFNQYVFSDSSAKSLEYLEAGKTYLIYQYIVTLADTDAKITITKADENTYKAWLDEIKNKPAFDIPSYEEINIGDLVNIKLNSYVYNDVSKYYKYTATEDVTLVAYSVGSNRAGVTVYDENGIVLHSADENAAYETICEDFTVIGTLSKGESCYFEVFTYEYFGDSFMMFLTTDKDYTPVK